MHRIEEEGEDEGSPAGTGPLRNPCAPRPPVGGLVPRDERGLPEFMLGMVGPKEKAWILVTTLNRLSLLVFATFESSWEKPLSSSKKHRDHCNHRLFFMQKVASPSSI
jgi:hypothetical protein